MSLDAGSFRGVRGPRPRLASACRRVDWAPPHRRTPHARSDRPASAVSHGPSLANQCCGSCFLREGHMSRVRGFSLVELMITLVIAGLVLAIGMPAFGHFRNTLLLKQANAQLLQDVLRARQLAVTRRAPVVVCFGAPPTTSNITSYTIHVDTNGDGVVQGSEMIT